MSEPRKIGTIGDPARGKAAVGAALVAAQAISTTPVSDPTIREHLAKLGQPYEWVLARLLAHFCNELGYADAEGRQKANEDIAALESAIRADERKRTLSEIYANWIATVPDLSDAERLKFHNWFVAQLKEAK